MVSFPLPWIRRVLQRPENAFLCEVDESFIQNKFNLVGLEDRIPNFKVAVSIEPREYASVEMFYGLVHARYVMTVPGIKKMLQKYADGHFGHCPRVYCKRSPVLPIGLNDVVGCNTVRLYCPRCRDVYVPAVGVKGAAVDGAYFGTGFPHMAFMSYPNLEPPRSRERYEPNLYGFRIRSSADHDGVRRLLAVDTCVGRDGFTGNDNTRCNDKSEAIRFKK